MLRSDKVRQGGRGEGKLEWSRVRVSDVVVQSEGVWGASYKSRDSLIYEIHVEFGDKIRMLGPSDGNGGNGAVNSAFHYVPRSTGSAAHLGPIELS